MTRRYLPLVLILAMGAFIRTHLAAYEPYVHDEENTWIPLAETISFHPTSLNLPLRAESHPALPAYVVAASRSLFGTSRLGTRFLHVVMGLMTVALIWWLAWSVHGPVAAHWAAALMAFNEYALTVSSRATAHVPQLLFLACALLAFSWFLEHQQAGALYVSSAFVGLAFYCKEHSALFLPVFFLTLLQPAYRRWLRSPHAYLGCVLFVLVIAPDIYWNLTTDRANARVSYGGESIGQATYTSHLERIGGLGLSPYPVMFYAHGPAMAFAERVTGTVPVNNTPEYQSMNPALGAVLVGGVLATAWRSRALDPRSVLLLLQFLGLFGFFSLIRPGDPPGRLDAVSWMWVESTLLAAAVLAGGILAQLRGAVGAVVWAVTAGALIYAVR